MLAFVVLSAIVTPLAVTVASEWVVARGVFELEGRDLGAIVVVNLVTNPVLNSFFLMLWGLAIGMKMIFVEVPGAPGKGGYLTTAVASWVYLALLAFEVVIVLVEWRLLAWAVAGRAGTSWRVLRLSVAMNAVSGGSVS